MRKAPGLEQALSSGSRAMSFLMRERGSCVVPVASVSALAAPFAVDGAARLAAWDAKAMMMVVMKDELKIVHVT